MLSPPQRKIDICFEDATGFVAKVHIFTGRVRLLEPQIAAAK